MNANEKYFICEGKYRLVPSATLKMQKPVPALKPGKRDPVTCRTKSESGWTFFSPKPALPMGQKTLSSAFWNPLTSYPLKPVPSYVQGKKSLFFPSPCIEWSLYTDKTSGVDWWIVYMLGTGPYLLYRSWPVSCIVYHFKLFQIETINRE